MATGKYPFKGNSKEELKHKISKGEIDFSRFHIPSKIRLLISKMTIKDQNNRPTAEKLLESHIFFVNHNDSMLKSRSHMKISFTGYHTHPNISMNKSLTFELEDDTLDGKCHQSSQMTEISSYKSFSVKMKNQRINGRLLPLFFFFFHPYFFIL